MAKSTEREIGIAVMRVLADQPNGEADVRRLIELLPDYFDLTDEDRKPSDTRPNEQMWEQQVRNLKSHDTTPGNVIADGFIEHVERGRYRLTQAGRAYLATH